MSEIEKKRKKYWLVSGIIFFLFLLAGICSIGAYKHLTRSYHAHTVTRCLSNLKLNGVLCYLYAEENNGKFPDTADYIKQNSGYMQCLNDPDPEGDSYFLIPGLSKNNSPGMPLMIEKTGNHKDRQTINILYVGGHVMRLKKTVQTYTELLPGFSTITPAEREYLHRIFAEP